jgi:hypothetical protein
MIQRNLALPLDQCKVKASFSEDRLNRVHRRALSRAFPAPSSAKQAQSTPRCADMQCDSLCTRRLSLIWRNTGNALAMR